MTYLESSKKFLPQKMPHLLLGQGMSQNLKEMTSENEKKTVNKLPKCHLFCNITKTKEKFVNRQQAKNSFISGITIFHIFLDKFC